jgi:hypothetical protein
MAGLQGHRSREGLLNHAVTLDGEKDGKTERPVGAGNAVIAADMVARRAS